MSKKPLLLIFVFLFQWLQNSEAQQAQKEITHQQQYWLAYMTSARISDNLSIWNDFHYVPEAFGVLRTGLSMHLFNSKAIVTGGYAFLGLAAGSITTDLKRNEHRPWGQVVFANQLTPHLQLVQRIRYDARFRQTIEAGELIDNYDFNHRIRFLVSLRQRIPQWSNQYGTPFFGVTNETLVNFGDPIVYNSLDQFRTWATVGWQKNGLNFQMGYMSRFVQLPVGNKYVHNHHLLIWLTQSFDLRKDKSKAAPKEPDRNI